MNIKDLPQGSYKVIHPGTLNIKDLPQGSYQVVSGNAPAPAAQPLTGKEQRLAKATGQAPSAPVVPETPGYQDTSGPLGFLKARANQLNESLTRGETGQQTGGETGFQFASNTVLGPTMDVIGKILTPIDKVRQAVLNQGAGRVANVVTGKGNKPVADESPMDYITPRAAANTEAALNIGQAGLMLGGGGKAKEKVQQELQAAADRKAAAPPKTPKIVEKRVAELKQIENNYAGLRKMKDYSNEFDASRSRVASTDVLHNSVSADGKIATKGPGGAVEQYKRMTLDDAEGVVRKNIVREGRAVSVKSVEDALTQEVQNSGLEGADLRNALNKVKKEVAGYRLKADANGNIPLEVIHDAKVNTYNNTNYLTPPEVAKYNKTLARGLKKLVENNSDLPVGEINKELGNYLQDIKYLESLDGKIVKGGRLTKILGTSTGSVIGSVAGHALGPLGSIAGGVLGSEVANRIIGSRLANTLKGKTGTLIERSKLLNDHINMADTPPEPITVKNYLERNQPQSRPATTPNSMPSIGEKLFTKRESNAPTTVVRPADLQDYAKVYAEEKAKPLIRVNYFDRPDFPRYIPKALLEKGMQKFISKQNAGKAIDVLKKEIRRYIKPMSDIKLKPGVKNGKPTGNVIIRYSK